MIASEVVTITREEYAALSDKAQKWDNAGLDHRIVYVATRTEEQFQQFVADSHLGERIRLECEQNDLQGPVWLDMVLHLGLDTCIKAKKNAAAAVEAYRVDNSQFLSGTKANG